MFVHLLSSIFLLEPLRRAPKGAALPPLPEIFRDEIARHNGDVLRLFELYLRAVVRAASSARGAEALPLSGITWQPRSRLASEPLLAALARAHAGRAEVRSQYYALLGCADSFTSPSDLVSTARSDLLLDIPLARFDATPLREQPPPRVLSASAA